MIKNNAFSSSKKRRFRRPPVKVLRKVDPLKRLSKEFAHLTTCHGFRQIAAPNRRLAYRLVWAAVIFGLFCGLAQELYDKLYEYTFTETITDLHEEYVRHLEFPAVTICNSNRFEKTFDELEFAKMNALVQTSYHHQGQHDEDDQWWSEAVEAFHKELEGLGKDTYFLREELSLHGWKLNDSTLRHCTFEKRKCTMKNFTKVVTAMGLCYTFVAEKGNEQKVPGSGHGLELYLDVNQFEYTKNETSNITSGIKVIIHEPGDPPMVERFAPLVASGHTAHIALKKTKRALMYKPWGQCETEHKDLLFHPHYTVASCMDECHVQYVIDRCKCKPFWDTMFEAPECDAWKILNCAGKAEVDFPLNETVESCGCPIPCEFNTYEAIATSDFPGIEVAEFLGSDAYRNKSSVDLNQIEYAFEKLRRNGKDHVMLDVFYDKLSYTSIIQRKSLTSTSLMSDIGGLLGLWLGISFVTIAEFLQFGLDCFELSMGWKKGYGGKDVNMKVPTAFGGQPPDIHFGVGNDSEEDEDEKKDEKEEERDKKKSEEEQSRTSEKTRDFSDF